jgi:hypothetical protein
LGAADAGAHLQTLGAAAAVALLAASFPARAQIAGSVSLVSDYRLRAASLSDRKPAASLTLSDDLTNGVYFGATVVAGQTHDSDDIQILGHIEYLGYAHAMPNGLTWEVGADNVDFNLYPEPNFHLSYTEAYAGLSNGTISSRLYLSPNYLQAGLTTAYLEVNGVARPTDDWRLTAHVGLFKPLGGNARTPVRKDRMDVRFEAIRRIGPTEVNVGWTSAFPAAFPTPWRTGSAFVAGVTAYF